MADQTGIDLPASGVTFRPYPATVGRVVHYTSYDTEHDLKACRAATVTLPEDDTGRVGLCVLHPTGPEFLTDVPAHHIDDTNPEVPRTTEGVAGRQPGTWHWPERA